MGEKENIFDSQEFKHWVSLFNKIGKNQNIQVERADEQLLQYYFAVRRYTVDEALIDFRDVVLVRIDAINESYSHE